MNVIKIELCAEDRERLDRLTAALDRSCSSCASTLAESIEAIFSKMKVAPEAAPAVVVSEPVPETPAPAADQAPWETPAAAPVPEVSLAEFQKALTLRCSESAETKAKVRALLNQYAAAASAVPPEKRAEVLAKLQKI